MHISRTSRRGLRAMLACLGWTILVTLLLSATELRASAAPNLALSRPVDGAVTRGFDPPDEKWGAGHRGVDLAASPGTPVRASADGVVSFAGVIAGRGVVALTHDASTRLRTTYEPVEALVRPGQRVRRGQQIGRVASPSTSTTSTHDGLHWGLIEGETYLNPLSFSSEPARVTAQQVRLLPADARPRPVETVPLDPADLEETGIGLPLASGSGGPPADGPITSRFGMRKHPVLGIWKLHDGLDIGAPCGAPVRAALPGTVVRVERHVAYGNRVIVDHGSGNRTGYAHLSAVNVSVGQGVGDGQQLGRVGTTGWSTGCHLHLMAWSGGSIVDPSPLLSG